jgi:transposase
MERKTAKPTRRKIDAALRATSALEAMQQQATMADLAQRDEARPERIYAWKNQPLQRGSCARSRRFLPGLDN